jgi:hypothetical protein
MRPSGLLACANRREFFMATRSQIEQLSARIEQIAERCAPKVQARWAKIIVEVDETKEQAFERHFREPPEDREVKNWVICQIVDPPHAAQKLGPRQGNPRIG